MKNIVISTILMTQIMGCSPSMGKKEMGGSWIGGATGALIGAQFGKGDGKLVGVALGALLGSQLGGALGQKLDQEDKALINETLQSSLESSPDRVTKAWRNPNTHHQGRVKVQNTQIQGHRVCRNYIHTVEIEGQSEQVQGRACRNDRGIWIVTNQ